MRILILDGYVDEPTCLGVPPYISTYVRYVAGALVLAGIPEESISYLTIDEYRKSEEKRSLLNDSDAIFLIAGMTVPGRYLGGKPITEREIEEIGKLPIYKVVGGPVKFGFALKGGVKAKPLLFENYDLVVKGDIELAAYKIGKTLTSCTQLPEGVFLERRTASYIDKIAPLGAFIVKEHPYFPYVICEVETFRGCERKHHCSYCTEAFYGHPDEREPEKIIEEIKALYSTGVKYFRIGRQPNILGYKAISTFGEFSIPNVEVICNLFRSIRNIGDIKTLHIDNVNAGTIDAYPEESKRALYCIANHDTEGDVAPFGLETADEEVIKKNYLKVNPEGIKKAIRIVNEVGAFKERKDGLYKLLPGINFLVGLPGETKKTFEKNKDFLKSILDEGLLLRRINIRQVMIFEGTQISEMVKKARTKYRKEFEKFKQFVREEIDFPMMKKVFPVGTVIKEVLLEAYDGGHTLGRQIGSYPVLVRIPEKLELFKVKNVIVVGHRERSVIGIPIPININNISHKLLSYIPGISKKLATEIVLKRPFKDKTELLTLFPQLSKFSKYIITSH
ncbi:Radical SAM domain protein [Desulfurobacterium thermolithotrophum DSM 11699]|uniref:Radical SAM domain protein n=1 Tax=Desulfurobacterium thermolithotrophum (strain DSM 11699 / BSA) TaxID=868864 RepID=F0S366_DESTD|nr:radical SAM protein [Desulfurobacterium thermolithotrophum]ADY73288.1 Radical SAM domain protein [Desulfurobacterium thermolithotrophum DSM 11699]